MYLQIAEKAHGSSLRKKKLYHMAIQFHRTKQHHNSLYSLPLKKIIMTSAVPNDINTIVQKKHLKDKKKKITIWCKQTKS